MDKFCRKCGTPLEADALFCTHCGTKVTTPGAGQAPEAGSGARERSEEIVQNMKERKDVLMEKVMNTVDEVTAKTDRKIKEIKEATGMTGKENEDMDTEMNVGLNAEANAGMKGDNVVGNMEGMQVAEVAQGAKAAGAGAVKAAKGVTKVANAAVKTKGAKRMRLAMGAIAIVAAFVYALMPAIEYGNDAQSILTLMLSDVDYSSSASFSIKLMVVMFIVQLVAAVLGTRGLVAGASAVTAYGIANSSSYLKLLTWGTSLLGGLSSQSSVTSAIPAFKALCFAYIALGCAYLWVTRRRAQ